MFWNRFLCIGALLSLATAAPLRGIRDIDLAERAGPISIPGRGGSSSSSEEYHWRADTRSPQEIEAAGGFWAKGTAFTEDQRDYSIYNHVYNDPYNTAYVSTTISRDAALRHNQVQGNSGWLYKIHADPRAIPVADSLGAAYGDYSTEEEYVYIDGIPWEQVVSWAKITNGRVGNEQQNPSYNPAYNGQHSGGARTDLAGCPAPTYSAGGPSGWSKRADNKAKDNKANEDKAKADKAKADKANEDKAKADKAKADKANEDKAKACKTDGKGKGKRADAKNDCKQCNVKTPDKATRDKLGSSKAPKGSNKPKRNY